MPDVVLSRDMFLEIREELSGIKDDYVEVIPGIKARVVQLTADAGFALVAMGQNDDDKKGADSFKESSFRWICACILDNNNNPVFTMEDLKSLPFELIQRLTRAVYKVNGLSSPQGVEEAEKN